MNKRRWLWALICALVLTDAAAMPVRAAETPAEAAQTEETPAVENGWDKEKTHYYKDGKALTGLVTIDKKKYFFDQNGVAVKNKFRKNVKDGKKKYTFYFGADGAAYKAKKNKYEVTCKVKKIGGKAYGFDENSHMVTGIWVDTDNKLYVFKKTGKQDTKKTKKLRKLVKVGKKSKSMLKNVKKSSAFGKPKKTKKSSSCFAFGNYSEGTVFKDYVLLYANVEVQLTKNESTGVYRVLGVFPKQK